jgi:FtsH-binding integral membrane protein
MNRREQTFVDDMSNYAGVVAVPATASDRATFITKTYMHLLGAILAFTGIEVFLFQSGAAEYIMSAVANTNWLIILGAFIIVSWGATHLAQSNASMGVQYLGLGVFVVAEALIFAPLLYIADRMAPGTISYAAACTMIGFTGLTLVAFGTRKDFSFLRGILAWAGLCAILLIIGAVAFGFTLGVWFSVGMVALAGASILYDTSKIMTAYPTDRYVAASLSLFASVAMMFWYILRIFLSARR